MASGVYCVRGSSTPKFDTCVTLPVLPLVGAVLFPGQTLTLGGVDGLPLAVLKRPAAGGVRVAVLPVAVADDLKAGKGRGNRAAVAVEARIGKLKRLASGEVVGEVTGLNRRQVLRLVQRANGLWAETRPWPTSPSPAAAKIEKTLRFAATLRALRVGAVRIGRANAGVDETLRRRLATTQDPARLADLLAPLLTLTFDAKLDVLGSVDLSSKVESLLVAIGREERLLDMSDKIRRRADRSLKEDEKRSYLKEQLRVIKQELGESESRRGLSELDELAVELEAKDLPPAARDAVERELARLATMGHGTPEYMVSHAYLTWIRELPWQPAPLRTPQLAAARRALAQNHYGLTTVKERILEYLAVMRHKGAARGELLLLVGPPGVGKSTLAKQIAAALGRPFAKVALGGVKDEAEVRGHRRTYVGSLPGKIIQAMRGAGTTAPVILLDEIDKIGLDYGRGGVAHALLEALDYGQNHAFVDHYLGIPYDLSQVVFIATANSTSPLPAPLLDRMEIVELPSYTEQEKLEIARRHLLPTAATELGLKTLKLTDDALTAILRQYTREAGVRQLQRAVMTIGRKMVLAQTEGRRPVAPTEANLSRYLGPTRYPDEPVDLTLPPGVALGLAYTSVGGDILYVETSLSPVSAGKGRLTLTGSLGNVMKESAQAAWAYIGGLTHSKPEILGLDPQVHATSHLHLHLPGGAVPKDGPSAGVAILCAIASQLTGRALPAKLAMTGEISLRGQVLAVGGLKEKLLAAHRYGKRRVMIPAANRADLDAVPREVLRELEILPVATLEEALKLAGLVLPTKLAKLARTRPERVAPIGRIYDLR